MPSVIHLVDQVRDPDAVYRRIVASAQEGATVIDLTAGRVGGASQLELVNGAPSGLRLMRAAEYLGRIATPTREAYVRWVGEIGDRVICDGKSIKQWFTYNDEISLWWMTSTAQKGQITSSYRWLFFAFGMIDLVFETGEAEQGSEWHLWVPKHEVGRMLGEYIGQRGRSVIHSDAPPRQRENPVVGLRRRVHTPLQHVLGALKLRRHTEAERADAAGQGAPRGRVLVATQFPRSWKDIPEDERTYSEAGAFDFYLGYLPWKLREEGFEVVWLSPSSNVKGYTKWKRDAIAKQDLPDGSAWATIDATTAAHILKHHVRWCLDYDYLFRRNKSDKLLTYKDVAIGSWIVEDYRSMCLGKGVSAMVDVEKYRRVAETLQPKAVLYRDEMFLSGRAISAGMNGRTCLVGLQHGIITDEATTYVFDASEVAEGPEDHDHIRYCPVPDLFAAFGEYVREAFARWEGYPARRVVATGGARHDELVERHVLKPRDRVGYTKRLRKDLGLPFDRCVVALLTQRAVDAGWWFELLARALAEVDKEAFIGVKLHQFHGGEEAVRGVAEDLGIRNYKLLDGHTYPLIASADIVVSGPSTIVLESYLLDTPVISIFDSDEYESYPYSDEGLGVVVKSHEAMKGALANLISKKHMEGSGLNDRRLTALLRHLWNDDGQAFKRIADVLEHHAE